MLNKKIFYVLSLCLIPLLGCQTEIQHTKNDIEFDNGSKITSINLSPSKIEDLAILGKVWGYLKYYHPTVAKGEFNWDYELFRIMPKIIESKSVEDRNRILSKWIKRIGDFEVGKVDIIDSSKIKLTPDLVWITDKSILGRKLVKQLIRIRDAKRVSNFYVGFVPGIGNPDFKNEKPDSNIKNPDAGFRLLSLYRYWNIIQYFYPNRHLIEKNWHNVLTEFIPKYINASNEIEYKLVVLELIARIHDTHANIWGKDEDLKKYWGVNYAPLEITFIENKAVVTDFLSKNIGVKSELQIGDVISSVNNKLVEEIVLERLKYTPASNYPTQLRNIATNLLRANDSTMNIEFIRRGVSGLKKIRTYSADKLDFYKSYQSHDTCFKFINPNIGYLYLGSIKKQYLYKIMSKVQNTKGLIIDLRCYPSDFVTFSLGEYLTPNSRAFVKFTCGSTTNPGLFTFTPNLSVGMTYKDYYKGKVVILINEITQSQAEYTTMAFRATPNATVIGSTTAGADGNVSFFYLPGGINTAISGIGIYYPDGRETQRVGIVPDIEVKPTIKGIKENRDELIEKAIEIINKK